MSDNDDDDWFNKDEDEIVQSLQQQVKLKVDKPDEERIECGLGEFLNEMELDGSYAGIAATKSKARFSTGDLVKALEMSPLEMFLYFMADQRDIFKNQIAANDSFLRLQKYVKILTTLCQLRLGGYDEQFLGDGFAKQTLLLELIKRYALKFFAPSAKKDALDADLELMLRETKMLLLRSHKLGVLTESGYMLVEYMKKLIGRCQQQHALCLEFTNELEQVQPGATNKINDIYPTLDDLLGVVNSNEPTAAAAAAKANDVTSYIDQQRQLLCEGFARPLREFVQSLRLNPKDKQPLLWRHTQIVLNPAFADAERHSLIFMDIRPKASGRTVKTNHSEAESAFLMSVKTGTLLCFTSSLEFENLILATAGYTAAEMLQKGYLSIEIARQYNIGNIYGKPLLMFEAPEFFEPYLRVHKNLSSCNVENFPMARYIIEGVLDVAPPAYMKSVDKLLYKGSPFSIEQAPKQAALNEGQGAAFSAALRNEFCLIQGPPGTGKTHLSVELVNTLLQNAETLKTGPLVLLAYTNDSLDKFLLQISQHTDSIARFGCQSRELRKYDVRKLSTARPMPATRKRVWWLTKGEYKQQFERLQALHANFDGSEEAYQQILEAQQQLQLAAEKLNTLRTIFHYYVAREQRLLAMTTTCAARYNFLFRLLQSKTLLFEEAAEIAEAHVLACLTPYAEHVIFIGDHKQLKPYTGHHVQQVSLFERLITNGFPVTVLNLQYRMRSCIAELLVPTFYADLKCHESVEAYPNIRKLDVNLYFVAHKQAEHLMTNMSIVNKHEAGEVLKLAVWLVQVAGYACSDIVVLSPYNAQVEHIKQKFKQQPTIADILVASVDSYQGLQANIVLLSLVRSNPNGHIGFLRQPNRVCVALSRARWALYMIGNMDTLLQGNHKLWSVIHDKLLATKAIGNILPICRKPN
ncbi:CG6204 [Drosophila busckii]|uniref:CG6204 n=1 Tax=Drosophila busckii TaxID=30019 RepID=A0A0M4EHI1_DROBS|nr:NFX1-type zinc finger-containing protein 1 [Drosophila busckii]ALC45834.1 CG6204 [Drosophila busckii]